jgi:hypothetical protein
VRPALAGCAAAALLCAGCGGGGHSQPPQPRLPRALAAAWSREAAAIASALAAGDSCGAERQATRLRAQVIAAVNARRVPAALLEPLTSAVNSLPERITCTPPAPAPAAPSPPAKPPKPKPGKPPKPPHDHGHGHGHDRAEGD